MKLYYYNYIILLLLLYNTYIIIQLYIKQFKWGNV